MPGALFVARGLAVLLALGTWQLERMAWKEELIATLEPIASGAAPAPLPPPCDWASLDAARSRVPPRRRCASSFLHDSEALVYTGGSALRDDVEGAGLLRLHAGAARRRQRSWSSIAASCRRPSRSRAAGRPAGRTIVGVLRWPEQRGLVHRRTMIRATTSGIARDPAAMAQRKGLGRGGAVLHRAGSADAARRRCRSRRTAAAQSAEQSPAICADLVRAGGSCWSACSPPGRCRGAGTGSSDASRNLAKSARLDRRSPCQEPVPAHSVSRPPPLVSARTRKDSLVRYVSTRGEAPPLGFIDVTLAGLARDGGLYVPEILAALVAADHRRVSPAGPMPRSPSR